MCTRPRSPWLPTSSGRSRASSVRRCAWSGRPQPADPTTRRAECSWSGKPGTGAEFAAALRGWPMLRFEVTEEPSPGFDGERFMHVPGRGLFRAAVVSAATS